MKASRIVGRSLVPLACLILLSLDIVTGLAYGSSLGNTCGSYIASTYISGNFYPNAACPLCVTGTTCVINVPDYCTCEDPGTWCGAPQTNKYCVGAIHTGSCSGPALVTSCFSFANKCTSAWYQTGSKCP